ncbi:tetratricopeptide repeat protein 12-like isoform X2 [Convolutriloba macropyga]|uniref:tetratricopeptide repeat protein 12-like isoform X2 n=1 Tax=Convolutriloba macropyga TaxID=536237 RepID=UPI003F51BD7E
MLMSVVFHIRKSYTRTLCQGKICEVEAASKRYSKNFKRDSSQLWSRQSRTISKSEQPFSGPQTQSKESWMDEIAADAERRAKARKQRKHESDLLKIKGNEKLSAGDLEGAYKLYSEGLDIMKDNLPLWTNRAQVLIKLNRFPEAIEDCDFAFRIDETCMKAFVHKSKALAYLGKFDDARNCLQESLDAENSAARKKTVAEYLDLIDEIEKKADLDVKASEAKESASSELQTISAAIIALQRPDQSQLFYMGAIECLNSLIQSEEDRALFRNERGIEALLQINNVDNLEPNNATTLSEPDWYLLTSIISLLKRVCTQSFANIEHLVENHSLLLSKLLSFANSENENLNLSCLELIEELCADNLSRRAAVRALSASNILNLLWNGSLGSSIKEINTRLRILNALLEFPDFQNALVVYNKSLKALSDTFSKTKHEKVLSQIGGLISILLSVTNTANFVANSEDLFKAILKFSTTNLEMRSLYLGLLYSFLVINTNWISSESGERIFELCKSTVSECATDNHLLASRVLSIVKQLSSHDQNFALQFWDDKSTLSLIFCQINEFNKLSEKVTQDLGSSCQFGIGALAVIMKNAISNKLTISNEDISSKRFANVIQFLKLTSKEQSKSASCANSALVLGFIFESGHLQCVQALSSPKTSYPDLCKDLLSIASNNGNNNVRGNVAIALSKLVTKSAQHLEQLRKLDGMKILHDCIKFVDV